MLAALSTKANGKMENNMGMESRSGQMVQSISANTVKGERKDLGCSSGQTAPHILVSGLRTRSMDVGSISGLIVVFITARASMA